MASKHESWIMAMAIRKALAVGSGSWQEKHSRQEAESRRQEKNNGSGNGNKIQCRGERRSPGLAGGRQGSRQ